MSNPKMSDYPLFSGRMEDWYLFKDQFEGTAQGQGLGWVLRDHAKDSDTLDDPVFKANSAFLYSVLKRNCAKGTAAVKVRKFSEDSDGYGAWKNLKEYYESHGSVEQFVADCTTELYKLKLDWNSQAGFERYVSDFETICLRLEETKNPLTEIQKKTRFLAGIQDKDYNEIVTICRHDEKLDFEATVRKVRSEAKAKGKLKNNKPTRQTNNTNANANATKTNPKGKGRKSAKTRKANQMESQGNESPGPSNPGSNAFVSPTMWAKLDKDQKKTILRIKNEVQQGSSSGYGKQYTKQANQAQTSTKPEVSHDAATVVTGNIWRSTPPRKASMMRKTAPPKDSSDEDVIVWVSKEELEFAQNISSLETDSLEEEPKNNKHSVWWTLPARK